MNSNRDFTIIKKLGEGAFSNVYQVKRISDGAIYAMKKVKMGKLTEKEKQNALNEIRILASINHVNVIGYKEAFFENTSGSLCIIMEMADDGDLLQHIDRLKRQRKKFTEKQIWHYLIQVVRGLKALHDLKIVHRDIKCANLFLTKDGTVKLGDLNVSKVAKSGLMHTQTGTPYYASPEVWMDKPYDYKSDIWSLGTVLYEIITLQPPFKATSMAGLQQKVIKGQFEMIPAHFSSELSQVIRSCIQVNPSNRPTCAKLLQMPGIKNNLTERLEMMSTEDDGECLLKTIRCPRNLGMISERLPKPQYDMTRRSSSLTNSTRDNDSTITTPSNGQRQPIKGAREHGGLPVIDEELLLDEYAPNGKGLNHKLAKVKSLGPKRVAHQIIHQKNAGSQFTHDYDQQRKVLKSVDVNTHQKPKAIDLLHDMNQNMRGPGNQANYRAPHHHVSETPKQQLNQKLAGIKLPNIPVRRSINYDSSGDDIYTSDQISELKSGLKAHRNESDGVSQALGFGSGAPQARRHRLQRENRMRSDGEIIMASSPYKNYHQSPPAGMKQGYRAGGDPRAAYQQRGPCPQNISSLPSILLENDRRQEQYSVDHSQVSRVEQNRLKRQLINYRY